MAREPESGTHYWPPGLEHGEHGELRIAGQPVHALAAQHGTPLYVYDAEDAGERIQALRSRLPHGVRLHYAVKANPHSQLLHRLAPWLDGMDVASAGELLRARQAGIAPGNISMAGPGKTDHDLQAAIHAGCVIGVESFGQLHRIADQAREHGHRAPVSIRINPDFRLKASGMHMGGGASPFGIDAEAVPEILEEARHLPVFVAGFQVYAGSQNLHADAIVEAQARSLALILELCPAGIIPEFVNLGGGFGIPYFPGDRPLEITPVTEGLERLQSQLQERWPETRLVLELGRYLVGESGVYITRVVDRKVSCGETFLVTDGGMHHHLAASGNLGQVVRRNYPVALATRLNNPETETVNIVGPLCTPLDRLAMRVRMPHAEPGDLIAIFQSGAYGLTASPAAFLDHPLPAEIVL
ncbi:pyridoxal-dependent decarboxylase, exosortase A system-associated [Thioalkalivibrio sp. ALJT]|uniref:pyridoxal-dependent decarboxylase, exosortase A system-associated n=1 Tax=Thioalkalivibrio sp. ALJT TaxID=1158146 RepID=UPI00035F9ADC|nr:pyridoxal-dependent decarboxylase, exosortase A system-associated [Thioalkalivibrio sp. ALJT]